MRMQLAQWFRFFALFCLGHIASGMSNSLTIKEKSGSAQTDVPIQLARPFVAGEVSGCPQPLIGGIPAVSWQADVKTRWPDGSVKHAIIAFLVPTLPANATVTVTFQTSACRNTALTKAEMMDVAYNFNAQTLLVNGSTLTADARAMLSAGSYTVWTSGQVAQTIILADHSNLVTCNGHPCSAYDIGFDANRSFRPTFHATFWPALKKVKIRFVGEVAQTESLQDMTYGLVLKTGNTNPTQVYSKAAVSHSAMSRWTVSTINNTHAQTDEIWIGGGPGPVEINHNLAYLAGTKALPNYDTSKVPTEADVSFAYSASAAFNGWTTANRDLYDNGNWTQNMGSTGGRPDIGPYPAWTVRWLYTGDARMQEQAFGNAELAAAWPVHFREGQTSRYLDRAHAIPGVGRVMSASGRPTVVLYQGNDYIAWTGTSTGDRLAFVGKYAANPWRADAAHIPEAFAPLYLLTGDYWFLEQMYFWAGWCVFHTSSTNAYYGRGPTGAEGGIHDQVRAVAWSLRSRVEAANLAPDSHPEKAYFSTLTADALAIWEGARNITTSAFNGTPLWNWGHTIGSQLWTKDGIELGSLSGPSPLGQWTQGNTGLLDPSLIDNAVAYKAQSPWEMHFLIYALGRAKELGYPSDALLAWTGRRLITGLTDPDYSPYIVTGSYREPTVRRTDGQWFDTWASVKAAFLSSYDPIAVFNSGSNIGHADHGYPFIALAAMAMVTDQPKGAAAWSWMQSHVLNAGVLNGNPKWAIMPRLNNSDGLGCDINKDGRVDAVDVQSAINQALGLTTCSTADLKGAGRCDIVNVQRMVNAALGAACVVGP